MRRVWILTLLAASLSMLPAAGAGENGGHCFYRIDSTLRVSDVMQLQERRLASDHALILMEGEQVEDRLTVLRATLALARGSVSDDVVETWEELLQERWELQDAEVGTGEAHWTSMQRLSSEAFVGAIPAALEEILARGLGHTRLCEDELGSCEGKNHSRRVALAVDGGQELEDTLNEIARRTWPTVTTYRTRPVPSVPVGAAREKFAAELNVPHVDVLALALSVEEIARTLELADAATDGDIKAQDEARQRIGEAMWVAVDRIRKKARKEGWGDVQACLNPPGWGGCGRGDVTDRAAAALSADKKLVGQMEALRASFAK